MAANPDDLCSLRQISLLPYDFFRALVLAKAQKTGVPQPPIDRPFRKADLCHELRLDPMDPAMRQAIANKRAEITLQVSKLLPQAT